MTYLQADPNTWYKISILAQPPVVQWTNISLTTPNEADGGANTTSTYLSPNTNNTDHFSWQLYPVANPPNGTYLLRPKTAIGGFMHAWSPVPNVTACIARDWDCSIGIDLVPTVGFDAVWTFTTVLDGTNSFYITNAANGSTYHLDLWPNGSWLRMTNNISGAPDTHLTQQYQVIPIGAIDNSTWQSIDSTVLTFPGANSTMPNVTFTDDTSSTTGSGDATSHHGLSTGAKVGIIVPVVVVVLALLGLLSWWVMRRRKQKHTRVQAVDAENDSDSGLVANEMDDIKKQPADYYAPLVEAPSESPLAEAPSESVSRELEGDQPRYELPAVRYR